MLPFLKIKKQMGGVSTQIRKPDELDNQKDDEQDTGSEAMDACAQDLLDAIHASDKKAMVSALKAIFEVMDSMPHVEGPHINEQE